MSRIHVLLALAVMLFASSSLMARVTVTVTAGCINPPPALE